MYRIFCEIQLLLVLSIIFSFIFRTLTLHTTTLTLLSFRRSLGISLNKFSPTPSHSRRHTSLVPLLPVWPAQTTVFVPTIAHCTNTTSPQERLVPSLGNPRNLLTFQILTAWKRCLWPSLTRGAAARIIYQLRVGARNSH